MFTAPNWLQRVLHRVGARRISSAHELYRLRTLPVLASVFVGGTPYWGGSGTAFGGAIGALIVTFIQTAVGLSGYYVQLVSGVIIILSLFGHRWSLIRYR